MKRNLLHIVLFVLLYVAVLFGVEFLGFATPFLWAYQGLPAALFAGFAYFYVAWKWKHFGAALVLNICLVLMLMALGEGNLFVYLFLIAVALMAEAIRYTEDLKTIESIRHSYVVMALSGFANTASILTDREAYLAMTTKEMGAAYAEKLDRFTEPPLFAMMVIASLAAAYFGIRLAESLILKKRKA